MNTPLSEEQKKMIRDLPLYERVGFDYIRAIRDMLTRMTYEELAFNLGYKGASGISSLLNGKTPSHVHGEALWALYIDTFGKKPPLAIRQSG